MKLLFDQNISFRVLKQIHSYFPEARHVKDFGLHYETDNSIWSFAKTNGFNIVTLDSDFYDLVTLKGHPPKVIWLRLGNTSSLSLARVFTDYHELIRQFLLEEQYKEIGCLEISK